MRAGFPSPSSTIIQNAAHELIYTVNFNARSLRSKSSGLIVVLIADISRRKRAEDALRNSEAQLRLAMEAADMGSWHWNIESGTMSFSEGFGPLFGLFRIFDDSWRHRFGGNIWCVGSVGIRRVLRMNLGKTADKKQRH